MSFLLTGPRLSGLEFDLFTCNFSRQTIVVNKYLFLSYLQAGEITRRLQEEEEAAMGSANAIKKLDAEIKRSKEEVENMDLRRVICIATNCRNLSINIYCCGTKFKIADQTSRKNTDPYATLIKREES